MGRGLIHEQVWTSTQTHVCAHVSVPSPRHEEKHAGLTETHVPAPDSHSSACSPHIHPGNQLRRGR